jgi:predicted metal-dependent TIM-barrel fold hydrolase
VDLETLRLFGVERALLPAHPLLATPTPRALLNQFAELTGRQRERCARAGITAHAALGLHPRALPRRGTDEVLSALPALMQREKVRAIGPAGLYRDTDIEHEVLVAQARLARRFRTVLLVTLPSANHERLTRRTLELLRATRIPARQVLVEGVTARTLPVVRALGYRAALSLHPDAMGADRAVALCRKVGGTGILLASHAGDGAADLLSLPRAQALLVRTGLAPLAQRVGFRNAAGLFGPA